MAESLDVIDPYALILPKELMASKTALPNVSSLIVFIFEKH